MTAELQELLCEQWCSDLEIGQDTAGIRLSLPLLESDGDSITVWVQQVVGGWKLRDCGTAFMRLSYDMDTDLLQEGQRSRVLERILSEHQVTLEDGELTCHAEERELGGTLLRFGQAIARVSDIKMWSRARVANTFYDDLRSTLIDIVGTDRLLMDYEAPGVPDASSYKIDFAVLGPSRPLYIFGVPSSDKAKLATIVLLHLQQARHSFDSLVIPSDIESIGKPDLRRLLNAANDFVDSSSSIDAITRKVHLRLEPASAK
jgi:hypothetical protein